MQYSFPKLTIYIPKQSGEYLLQRFRENPQIGYSEATGNPLRINRQTLEMEGADMVCNLLSEYPTRQDLGISSLDTMSASDTAQFSRDHWEVAVTLFPERRLKLCLIDPDETGRTGRGRDEHAIMLPVPCSSQDLVTALDKVVG